MYQPIVRPEAEQDIEDAYDWYESQKSGLGSEFVRAVDANFAKIVQFPLAYPTAYQQVHRVLLQRFPYGLFYTIIGNKIFVLACFHGMRDPKRWPNRFGQA